MQVEPNVKTVKFSEIKGGDCFHDTSTLIYYMKINADDTDFNAINIETGEGYTFGDDSKVIPLNLKVVQV